MLLAQTSILHHMQSRRVAPVRCCAISRGSRLQCRRYALPDNNQLCQEHSNRYCPVCDSVLKPAQEDSVKCEQCHKLLCHSCLVKSEKGICFFCRTPVNDEQLSEAITGYLSSRVEHLVNMMSEGNRQVGCRAAACSSILLYHPHPWVRVSFERGASSTPSITTYRNISYYNACSLFYCLSLSCMCRTSTVWALCLTGPLIWWSVMA